MIKLSANRASEWIAAHTPQWVGVRKGILSESAAFLVVAATTLALFTAPLAPYTFYAREHCLVVLGSDGESVQTMDPMVGFATYDRERFAQIFGQCGSMAAVLS